MTVELTIQEMFDDYPLLFKDRCDALNQLFCVLGNGYCWQNGELVGDGDPEPTDEELETLSSRLVDRKAFQHNRMSLRDEAVYYREYYAKNPHKLPQTARSPMTDEQFAQRIKEIPDDVYHRRPRRERWYFNTPWDEIDYHEKYVPLFNVPTDIKPDWAAAIAECRQMLEEDGYEDIPVTKPFIPEQQG